ncbi:hypothetical protein [Xenorhabdus sp. Sc-CR9]|nr:hypothetical protein [Xenorhabdus sp. Sc-CR9]
MLVILNEHGDLSGAFWLSLGCPVMLMRFSWGCGVRPVILRRSTAF